MPMIAVSPELKALMDANKGLIKNEFVTYTLFTDSAIRASLRRMGVDAGDDLIISHLDKLQASKSRHLDKAAIAITKKRHKLRQARNKRKLENI